MRIGYLLSLTSLLLFSLALTGCDTDDGTGASSSHDQQTEAAGHHDHGHDHGHDHDHAHDHGDEDIDPNLIAVNLAKLSEEDRLLAEKQKICLVGGEALGSIRQVDTNSYQCTNARCEEAEADGYYIQATYNVTPATKVGLSYGETNQDNVSLIGAVNNTGDSDIERSNELTTIGVYHDVNSWLKVVAEYNDQSGQFGKISNYAVGGFIFW